MNLLRFSNEAYCLSDYETESLNLCQDNRPWQLSWIIFNNKNILEKHDYYIWWPDLHVSEGAAKATGFNYDFYKKKARPQEEVWEIWQKYLYNNDLIQIQHNGINFDQYITQIWRKENKLSINYDFLRNYIDSNSLAKMWKLGIKETKRENWLIDWFKFGNYTEKGLKTSLSTLQKDLNIEFHLPLHDAGNDVLINKMIFEQLIYKINI